MYGNPFAQWQAGPWFIVEVLIMRSMVLWLSFVALVGTGCLPKTQKLHRRLGTAQMTKDEVLLGKVFGKESQPEADKGADAPSKTDGTKTDGSKPDGATDGSASNDKPDGATDGGGVPAGQFPDGATDGSASVPANGGGTTPGGTTPGGTTPGGGNGGTPVIVIPGGGIPTVPCDGKATPCIPTVPTVPCGGSTPCIPTVPCGGSGPCIPSVPSIPTGPCDGKTFPCIPQSYPTGGICGCPPGKTASPLIIALDGDSINLSSRAAGVKFDIDGDGDLDPISWPLKASSAFVVLDRNNNGKIDSVHELFGNNTVGPDNKKAANGFEALAKYDLNNDGVINAKDAIFSELRLWKDFNRNGVTDAGELSSLSSHKITTIDLAYKNGLETDRYGNQTRERSVVKMMVDGVEEWRMVFDIWFSLK